MSGMTMTMIPASPMKIGQLAPEDSLQLPRMTTIGLDEGISMGAIGLDQGQLQLQGDQVTTAMELSLSVDGASLPSLCKLTGSLPFACHLSLT